MNYLLTFFCFLMIMMPCLFAQERPAKDSSREKDEDIAEKVRDVDDKLSKLLARIDSKQKVQNNPELSPANIENSNGNAQFPEKISISPESEAESGFSSRDSNQTQINDGWNLFVLREMALKHSPDVLLKKTELRISKKGIPIIKFGRLPTLKSKVSFDDYQKVSQFETYSEPEPYNTFSYGLEGRWVLYDGHKKNRKEEIIARNEVNQAQWTLMVEEQKVLKTSPTCFSTQYRHRPKWNSFLKSKRSQTKSYPFTKRN